MVRSIATLAFKKW